MPDGEGTGKTEKDTPKQPPEKTQLSGFGGVAVSLARNPIGIIALFIVLIYGFACIVAGLGTSWSAGERLPLIYFLALFPLVVLAVFAWLVTAHHKKLYAPSDFRDEANFVELAKPALSTLRVVEQASSPSPRPAFPRNVAASEAPGIQTDTGVPAEAREFDLRRKAIADEARDVMLVHALQPSQARGQKFDVFIYLQRRDSGRYDVNLADVAKVEFFLGRYWRNEIFQGSWSGKYLGIRTSAYGPFLCVCKVSFADGGSAFLYRYVDFEMGEVATSAAR